MAWLKFTADKIFNGTKFLGDKQVLITTPNGVIENLVPLSEAGDDVQYHPGILSPGFINCHCHLELSHMKGIIPEKTGLVDFVITVMQQRGFAEEVIYEAIEQAEAEMISNGIMAVGDICNTAHTIPQKRQGNLYYYNFIEATGFVPAFAQKRFEQAEAVWKQFEDSEKLKVKSEELIDRQLLTFNSTLLTSSIVPHAPYSTSPELIRLINEHSAGKTITIHNQESQEENGFFLTGESGFRKLFNQFNIDISFFQPSGKTSLQTYLPELDKAGKLILVHNTFTSEEDVFFVNRQSSIVNRENSNQSAAKESVRTIYNLQSLIWCLCPNANLYIENTLPPVDMLRKHNCNIILGTDSLASNNMLCILGEVKTLRRHFPHIGLEEMLQWATLNGAKALGMDGLLGGFEKGKKPGVLSFNYELNELKRLA